MSKKRKKIGLALGSGSSRGYAHLGVLKVLQENNIPIDFIAGASAGAVVASLYSLYEGNLEKVEKVLTDWKEFRSLIDFSFSGGIIKGKKIFDYLEKKFEEKKFEDLKIPVSVVATDYDSSQKVDIKSGDIALGVRASMSIPFVFKLVETGGKRLADGGLSSPVPIKTVRDMGADIVIAVRIEDKAVNNNLNLYNMTVRSMEIMQHNLSEYEIKEADVLIDPYFENFGILGVHKILGGKTSDIIAEGERAALREIDSIKKLLGIKKKDQGIYKL